MSSLTLYRIEADLQELATLRDEAEDEGNCEALAVIDAQIRSYLTSEAIKIDSYTGLIHRMEADAQASENEEQRFAIRAKRLRANVERLKANALGVMQQFGVKELRTPIHTMKRVANGGVQVLEVASALVGDRYFKAIVTMPYGVWQAIRDAAQCVPAQNKILDIHEKIVPDNDAIREGLKRGEEIPGARLLPRGENLRLT